MNGIDAEARGGHSGLRRALEARGFRVRLRREGEPTVLEARRGGRGGFAIYIWTLGERLGELAPRSVDRDKLTRVLLDFVPERGVYLTLPPGQQRAPGVVSLTAAQVPGYLERLEPPLERSAFGAPQAYPARRRLRELEFALEPGWIAERRPEGAGKPIETGFAPASSPARPLSPTIPLDPCANYLFLFGVGTETGASIETTEATIPESLREGAELSVELFGFAGELELGEETRGTIRVDADGGATVTRPAATAEIGEGQLSEQLFFPLRTPGRPGRYRLRCNLYYGSTLIQSRLVSARVGGEAGAGAEPALRSTLDYKLASSVGLASLSEVPGHDLSLAINGNEDSHEFRFFRSKTGEEEFSREASLPAARVRSAIAIGRKALRMTAWGTDKEWDENTRSYRYANAVSDSVFVADLARLALAGSNIYGELARQLAGGVTARTELEALTLTPGKVQIASTPDAPYVPANLFYDHDIEEPPRGRRFELCPDFAAARKDSSVPLEQAPCIAAGCANRKERQIVCPSGFWGFRHELGWPTSSAAAVTELEYEEGPALLIGISTDPKLNRRASHIRKVQGLLPKERSQVVDGRDKFDVSLKAREAQVVYLYCHGGSNEEIPYVELGRPTSRQNQITYNHLRQGRPWGEPPPRPLVFINGCHTTALDPDRVLDLVSGFVEESEAAGVVGTELTVFEPLAAPFATLVLEGFLGGAEIGAAIRAARLELVRANNPLGLVYIPFVAAETRLVAS